MSSPARQRTWGGLVIVGVVLLFLAGMVWLSLSHATIPQEQARVSMPGMEDHLVNFWTAPAPPVVGPTTLTAKLTTTIGTPVRVDRMTFALSRPGQPPVVEVPAAEREEGAGNERVYVATAYVDQPGQWHIAVRFTMGRMQTEALFPIEVRGR